MVEKSIYVTRTTDFMGTQTEGVAVSSTSTYYSLPWMSDDGQNIHHYWTGTPTGTLTLWYSSKDHPLLTDDSDWVQDTGFTPTNPAGSAGQSMDNSSNSKSKWKRTKYVNASGSGVLYGNITHPSAV